MIILINEEKEKEILQIINEQKNDKLYSEVAGYISRLDSYIYKLEKENKKLKEKQDEKLNSIIVAINKYLVNEHRYRKDNLMIIIYDKICDIIEEYKEVSNGKNKS